MLFSSLLLTSFVSAGSYTDINAHQGASFAIADAGDVQAVPVAGHGFYTAPTTYNYIPNGNGGGTVYGSNGQTTTIIPSGGGGYTAYGSNGSTSTYIPNGAGGGTVYTNPGYRR